MRFPFSDGCVKVLLPQSLGFTIVVWLGLGFGIWWIRQAAGGHRIAVWGQSRLLLLFSTVDSETCRGVSSASWGRGEAWIRSKQSRKRDSVVSRARHMTPPRSYEQGRLICALVRVSIISSLTSKIKIQIKEHKKVSQKQTSAPALRSAVQFSLIGTVQTVYLFFGVSVPTETLLHIKRVRANLKGLRVDMDEKFRLKSWKVFIE